MNSRSNVVITSTALGVPRDIYVRELGEGARALFLEDAQEGERDSILAAAEALIVLDPAREISASDLSQMPRLRFVQALTAGIDHFPADLFPRSLPLGNTAGATAPAIAEHALALVLAAAKRMVFEHNRLATGEWGHRRPNRFLSGATAGLLGFGEVGRRVGHLLQAVGMRIEAINRSGKSGHDADFVGTLSDLDAVLERCDVFVVATALNASTHGRIGGAELRRMKSDAILVISSRAVIVDQRALYEHLVANPAFTACIDAWWSEPTFTGGDFSPEFPFMQLPNVIGSPHNAGVVKGLTANLAVRAAQNVRWFLANSPDVRLVSDGDRDTPS